MFGLGDRGIWVEKSVAAREVWGYIKVNEHKSKSAGMDWKLWIWIERCGEMWIWSGSCKYRMEVVGMEWKM